METILKLGKKLVDFNFNRKVIDKFIFETVRKEVKPGSKILDAGAGSIRYKKYFSDCIYKTQDFKQYSSQYDKIDYISDIINIPVEVNSFDVIICTEVLEHLPRPDLAIKEFSRILKPSGKLYLTAPLLSGIHQAPYHYYGGFSKFWYLRYLNKYDFKDIDIKIKKRFFTFYAQETVRALSYFRKSKKIRHKILMPLMLILVPIFLHFDKDNLDELESSFEFTIGYLVKAKKA